MSEEYCPVCDFYFDADEDICDLNVEYEDVFESEDTDEEVTTILTETTAIIRSEDGDDIMVRRGSSFISISQGDDDETPQVILTHAEAEALMLVLDTFLGGNDEDDDG